MRDSEPRPLGLGTGMCWLGMCWPPGSSSSAVDLDRIVLAKPTSRSRRGAGDSGHGLSNRGAAGESRTLHAEPRREQGPTGGADGTIEPGRELVEGDDPSRSLAAEVLRVHAEHPAWARSRAATSRARTGTAARRRRWGRRRRTSHRLAPRYEAMPAARRSSASSSRG